MTTRLRYSHLTSTSLLTSTAMLERAGVTLVGDLVRHIAVGKVAQAEISAVGFQREDIDINILSPSKVPVLYRWVSGRPSRPGQPGSSLPTVRRVGSRFRNHHHTLRHLV